eukprot:PhM_4_TR4532/c0_g1_i1/m.61958
MLYSFGKILFLNKPKAVFCGEVLYFLALNVAPFFFSDGPSGSQTLMSCVGFAFIFLGLMFRLYVQCTEDRYGLVQRSRLQSYVAILFEVVMSMVTSASALSTMDESAFWIPWTCTGLVFGMHPITQISLLLVHLVFLLVAFGQHEATIIVYMVIIQVFNLARVGVDILNSNKNTSPQQVHVDSLEDKRHALATDLPSLHRLHLPPLRPPPPVDTAAEERLSRRSSSTNSSRRTRRDVVSASEADVNIVNMQLANSNETNSPTLSYKTDATTVTSNVHSAFKRAARSDEPGTPEASVPHLKFSVSSIGSQMSAPVVGEARQMSLTSNPTVAKPVQSGECLASFVGAIRDSLQFATCVLSIDGTNENVPPVISSDDAKHLSNAVRSLTASTDNLADYIQLLCSPDKLCSLMTTVCLEQMLLSVLYPFQSVAASRNVDIDVRVDVRVMAATVDARRYTQVLRILLGALFQSGLSERSMRLRVVPSGKTLLGTSSTEGLTHLTTMIEVAKGIPERLQTGLGRALKLDMDTLSTNPELGICLASLEACDGALLSDNSVVRFNVAIEQPTLSRPLFPQNESKVVITGCVPGNAKMDNIRRIAEEELGVLCSLQHDLDALPDSVDRVLRLFEQEKLGCVQYTSHSRRARKAEVFGTSIHTLPSVAATSDVIAMCDLSTNVFDRLLTFQTRTREFVSKKYILVVNEDSFVAKSIAASLVAAGAAVVDTVFTADKLVPAFQSQLYHLVVAKFDMPNIMVALQALRSTPRLIRPKVALLANIGCGPENPDVDHILMTPYSVTRLLSWWMSVDKTSASDTN